MLVYKLKCMNHSLSATNYIFQFSKPLIRMVILTEIMLNGACLCLNAPSPNWDHFTHKSLSKTILIGNSDDELFTFGWVSTKDSKVIKVIGQGTLLCKTAITAISSSVLYRERINNTVYIYYYIAVAHLFHSVSVYLYNEEKGSILQVAFDSSLNCIIDSFHFFVQPSRKTGCFSSTDHDFVILLVDKVSSFFFLNKC